MLRLALTLALVALALPLPAQELISSGTDPGVFVYTWDEGTREFGRVYYSSRAEGEAALGTRRAEARAIASRINQQGQIGLPESMMDTVADWMIFSEQWHLWQEWVLQEYELGDIFDTWPGSARFAAVPGVPLRWEQEPEAEDGENGPGGAPGLGEGELGGRADGRTRGGGGGAAAEFAAAGGAGGLPAGAGVQEETEEAPQNVAVTLAIIAQDDWVVEGRNLGSEEGRSLAVDSIHDALVEIVRQLSEARYDVLVAILDEVEESEMNRERREAYIALRQREVTNLREIILNREAATELEIEGTTYLFSPTPLEMVPEDTISITTSHLSPHDFMNDDGSLRSGNPQN